MNAPLSRLLHLLLSITRLGLLKSEGNTTSNQSHIHLRSRQTNTNSCFRRDSAIRSRKILCIAREPLLGTRSIMRFENDIRVLEVPDGYNVASKLA